MKRGVLFYIFALILMVSANQPITIPLQTYPVYQQDMCRNIQGSVPVILRTSNNNHYTQLNTAQNQIPTDVANVLVNRVLSNPTINRILDPNTRFYNQNGVEVQKSIYNTGSVPRAYNGAAVPNVINNYIIVSPEYLKLNETDVKLPDVKEKTANKEIEHHIDNESTKDNNKKHKNVIETVLSKPHSAKGNRKKTTKKHRQKTTNSTLRPREEGGTRISENDEDPEIILQLQETPKLRKNKTRTEKKQVPKDTIKVNEFQDNTSPKKEKSVSNNDADHNNYLEKTASRSKSNNRNQMSKVNSKSDNPKTYDDMSMLDLLLKTQYNNIESQPSDILSENGVDTSNINKYDNSQIQLDYIEEQILNSDLGSTDTRVPRNSKEEAIIRDFRKKFPDVPESLARAMLSYIQGQFQNQFGHNFFYPNYPFSYNQYFRMPQYSDIGRSTVNKRRNKHRRRKQKNRRKNNNKKYNGNKVESAALKNSETIAPMTSAIIEKEADSEAKLNHSLIHPPEFQSEFKPELNQLNLELTSREQPLEEIQTTIETTPTEVYVSSFEQLTELPIEPTTKLDESEEYFKDIDFVEIKPEQDDDYNIEYSTVSTLGQEDTVPIMYDNRLIEDYYPVFTDNTGFIANNNEYYVKNLNDRYYYTTDKNMEINLNEDKRKSMKLFKGEGKIPERIYKESLPRILKYGFRDQTQSRHTYHDADRESLKNIAQEAYQIPRPIIQEQENAEIIPNPIKENEPTNFKTPPGLEFPDFITKKIDKEARKSNHRYDDSLEDFTSYLDDADKSSIYSDFKTPMYNGRVKPNIEIRRVKIPPKSKASNVETVYAESKVVKYGPESDDSIENDF